MTLDLYFMFIQPQAPGVSAWAQEGVTQIGQCLDLIRATHIQSLQLKNPPE